MIKNIQFIGNQYNGKQVYRRKLKIKLSDGVTIQIQGCYESYLQWGGTNNQLRETLPIAEKYNDWLHGAEL